MVQIDETITSYLTALKIEGKTPATIASYANSLEDFRRVGRRLGLPDTVREYDVGHVYQFLGAMQERGASPDYRHRRHRDVQTLFSWCVRMGLVDENIFKRVPRVKVGEKIKPPSLPRRCDSCSRARTAGPWAVVETTRSFCSCSTRGYGRRSASRSGSKTWTGSGSGSSCVTRKGRNSAGSASVTSQPRRFATTSSASAASARGCCSSLDMGKR